MTDVNFMMLLVLAEQEAGDEKTAEDKKEIHSHPSTLKQYRGYVVEKNARPGRKWLHVMPYDEENRYGPQDVDLFEAIHERCA